MSESGPIKVLAENKKARYEYFVEEEFECGIVLQGSEVKSIKTGRFAFSDAYAREKNMEIFLISFNISEYTFGTHVNHAPLRPRKLLLHKAEIRRIRKKTVEKGYTLIPLRVYLVKGLVKIKLGICKGKRYADKRDTIRKRDQKRDTDRALRQYR